MKKTILCLFFVLSPCIFASAQKNTDYIVTSELANNVKTPTEVYELVGRKRQSLPTLAIIETDGEYTGKSGTLKEILRGKTATTYQIGTDTFALPNKDYKLVGNILYNRKDQKLECVILEMKECNCDRFTGLSFRKDSVTQNTFPDKYKMILYVTEGVNWRQEGSFMVPGIPSQVIDTLDLDVTSDYALAVRTDDGLVCEFFWLTREERWLPNKDIFYEISLREGGRFKKVADGYTFDGKPIQALLILKSWKDIGGMKKQKHKKRVRS